MAMVMDMATDTEERENNDPICTYTQDMYKLW